MTFQKSKAKPKITKQKCSDINNFRQCQKMPSGKSVRVQSSIRVWFWLNSSKSKITTENLTRVTPSIRLGTQAEIRQRQIDFKCFGEN